MFITAVKYDISKIQADAVILNLFEGTTTPEGATGAVDKALEGIITKMIKDKEFKGKPNELAAFPTFGKIPASKVILVGLGKKDEFNADRARQAAAEAAKKARSLKAKKVITVLHDAGTGNLAPELASQMVTEGIIMGLYEFKKYISSNNNNSDKACKEWAIAELDEKKLPAIKKGIKTGQIIADSVNISRDLINEPPNVMTPAELADRASKIAKEAGLKCTVFNLKEIKKRKMGGLLAVAAGSAQEPRFIILEYKGNPAKNTGTLGIIGKGLTYDSGGLSLKPPQYMEDMKSDMSGAAAAICALRAIAMLKPKINVTAVIPATENMPGSKAYKPGDIITTLSGKTIEVFNTDAEGRICLADALSYAVKAKLSPLVDAATLTGACAVAIGPYYTGLFPNNKELAEEIKIAALQAGEKVWEMPMDSEYEELIKPKIADVRNTATVRDGGAITAAKFLEKFVEKTPWAHLDIAAPAYITAPKTYNPFGGTGVMVRTFVQWVMNRAN